MVQDSEQMDVMYIKIDMPPTRIALFKKRFIACLRTHYYC